MTVELVEKELDNKILRPIYLLYGPEKFILNELVKKIKKIFGSLSLGINYITLSEDDIDTIISNIETPAFGFDKKLIIVKNSGLFKKENKNNASQKIEKYISENIEIIKESSVIIFIEDDINKNSLYNIIDKNGCTVEINYLKPIQIKDRLKRICNAYGVNITDANLMYLIENSGTDMQELINEIRKLIEYAGKGGQIQKDDIDKLATKQIQAIIFDLTDDLSNKQIGKALEVLKNLIYNKEPVQKILITLYNHFKKIYLTKLAIELNKDVSQVLNLKPNQAFLLGKYKKQSMHFEKRDLEIILKELSELDYKFKNGNIDLEIGLQSILCKNCN